jgi:hypothetical protein
MRPIASNHRNETFDQWRERMLADTGHFIEWGLRNQDKVEWIPRHAVGRGAFTERVKTAFWTIVMSNRDMPD